jgi:hypothetical protein
MLKRSPRRTAWVEAAMLTLEGRLTGDPSCHLEAAERYGRMGNLSDRVLTLVAAARAYVERDELDQAEPVIAELSAFAGANQAPLLLAGLPVAESSGG